VAASAAARALAKDAKTAFDAGDWEKARDLYHRANDILPAPTLVLREARALMKLGRLVEASELLVRASRPPDHGAPAAFRAAAHEASAAAKRLGPRIPRLKIVDGGQTSELRLDGVAVRPALMNVMWPVDPGPHLIEGKIAGKPILAQRVHIAEGEHLEIVLQPPGSPTPTLATATPSTALPDPMPDDAPPVQHASVPIDADREHASSSGSTRRTLGLVVGGVGVAGLGLGLVTGLMATGKHSDLATTCPSNRCTQESQDALDSFHTLRTISDVGYVVGIAGLGAGAILFFTAPSDTRSTTAVVPWIGPGSAGMRGTF
jgi:hypothetical protein